MRKYYDEDDEYEQEQQKEEVQRELLPAVRLKVWDGLLALALGVCAFAGLWWFSFPDLSPDVWDGAVVAAGIRPPAEVSPGLWRGLAHGFYLGGVSDGNQALMWAGRLCGALTAGCAYLLLRSLLALLVRGRLRYAVRRTVVQVVAAALGAVFFTCADPVWKAVQTFSPAGLEMLLSLFAMLLWTGFLLHGGLFSAYASVCLLGFLAADTPMGFVLLAVAFGIYFQGLRRRALCENMPLLDPIVGQSAKWYLTFFWAVGLIAGIAANCATYMKLGGLDAAGQVVGDLPLAYLLCWWHQLVGAADGLGWVLGVVVCVLPFAVAAVMLPRAVDEEQFLPYHVGAVFFFTGVLAFAQIAMLSPLWFWTWSESAQVNSPYLLQTLMFLSAATAVFALVALGGDACCRNHARLAMQRFAELHEDGSGADATARKAGRGKRGGLVVFLLAGALLAAGVLPGRTLARTREMLGVIADYAREVVAECGPVHWIFTDGSFDARLELASAERGGALRALSMMGANTPYQQALRKRGVTDAEDLMALSMGTPMLLRTWMHDKPARMADSAIQLGFELWKKDGKELPVCSGVLARPAGMEPEACARGVEAANGLADRILDIYARGGLEQAAGLRFRELFLYVQWRIARLARMRAERADRAGDTQGAMKDVKLSDRLDNTNESLKRILAAMEKARATTLRQVSPREGLQLALARADFALARRYAEPILEADPDDPNANFGMGMSYYTQKQWSRSEEYLRRCLVKRPKEPAVWNNLAMTCLYQNRFDEAETHAKKALALIPDSAEVKDTLRQIAEARAEAAKKSAETKPADTGKNPEGK